MNTYSLYSLVTGLFSGAAISCPSCNLSMNVPDGHGCLLGIYDHLSQRVDLDSGIVIDYQPPQPSSQHEWREDIKRWVYVPTAHETCIMRRRAAYPQLGDLADALYWQAKGDAAPMQAYLARCEDVKTSFPKPQQ